MNRINRALAGGPSTALHAAEPGAVDRLLDTNICPGCDLRGADLRGARLRGADLRGVALHDPRLAGADLRKADLRHLDADLNLESVDLRGVRLEDARFAHDVTCGSIPEKGGSGPTPASGIPGSWSTASCSRRLQSMHSGGTIERGAGVHRIIQGQRSGGTT